MSTSRISALCRRAAYLFVACRHLRCLLHHGLFPLPFSVFRSVAIGRGDGYEGGSIAEFCSARYRCRMPRSSISEFSCFPESECMDKFEIAFPTPGGKKVIQNSIVGPIKMRRNSQIDGFQTRVENPHSKDLGACSSLTSKKTSPTSRARRIHHVRLRPRAGQNPIP